MRIAVLILLLTFAAPLFAVQPSEILPDPAQEARARALSKELRCLVCRNESIDESNAELAKDLRVLVRARILAGDSDEEALDFIVQRYGEFVLLNPRRDGSNFLLWAAGPAMFLIALGIAFSFLRNRSQATSRAEESLTEEERARLDEILKD